ncbi:MAG: hypothetical protein Q8O30_10655 [Candidatus Omnitrophota bacterium]|nr:hypothetical protein [Candidatus Omnitrophota bacterium]
MEKGKFVSIRISEEDKKLLDKDAKEESRTVSNLLIHLWRQWRKSKERKQK